MLWATPTVRIARWSRFLGKHISTQSVIDSSFSGTFGELYRIEKHRDGREILFVHAAGIPATLRPNRTSRRCYGTVLSSRPCFEMAHL